MSSPSSRRSVPSIRGILALAFVAFACLPIASATAADPDVPPFETIDLQKISLPSSIADASQPAYTKDGNHLLFLANATTGNADRWIVGEDGSNPTNLTGGVSGEPAMPNPGEIEQPALIVPFPDGKRVFFGPYGDPRVLECLPSVTNCQTKEILDIDLSGARPAGPIPPGGAVTSPQLSLGFGARPQLSPDGKHVMFADIRTESIEVMILAKLTRTPTGYVTSDPVVLNPAGPTSATDKDTVAWSDSSALFESKDFVDGGRAVTYVQVGGEAGGNPDVWELDLQTGERTRLTHNPDWQEDHGRSPDNTSDVFTIDSRNTHYLDYLSLMPYRSFFDAWEIAPIAQIAVAGAAKRSCAPFTPRLLPADGDLGGKLAGQDLQPYDGGDIRPSGNYQSTAMWKPDGTAVALSTQSFTTLGGAPYLEIAHFPARKPTKPVPVVSSDPGDWAPTHEDYHGALGANTDITLDGLASGTVTLHYAQSFFGIVANTATYSNYSDDGKSFVNGTDTVSRSGPSSSGFPTTVTSNLTLSGAHTGSLDRNITYTTPGTITGNSKVTYDGVTHEGVDTQADRCNKVRSQMAGPVKVDATAKRRASGEIEVEVTAAYKGAGLDEQSEDRRPVRGATVSAGGVSATTDDEGVAVFEPQDGDVTFDVSAGDTFQPTTETLDSGRTDEKACKKAKKKLKKAKQHLQKLKKKDAGKKQIKKAQKKVKKAKKAKKKAC